MTAPAATPAHDPGPPGGPLDDLGLPVDADALALFAAAR